MILAFKSKGTPWLVRLSKNFDISMATPITNYVFTLIDDLHRFKKFSKGELVALEETKVVVKGLKSNAAIMDYLILEMKKLNFTFIRKMSIEEYEKLVGVI